MSKKLNFQEMAKDIITYLGGRENLSNVNHCATRLRVVVKDVATVNQSALKKVNGVLGLEVKDAQVQVIVGAVIEDLFLEVEKQAKITASGSASKHEKKNIISLFTDFLQLMAGIMSPVIPSLIAAGFLTCLLLLLNLAFGLSTDNSTYSISYRFLWLILPQRSLIRNRFWRCCWHAGCYIPIGLPWQHRAATLLTLVFLFY